MTNKLLEVRQLSVAFESAAGQKVQALKGIDFDINRGEILGLAGESGSGKSVTALTLMGLLPKTANIISGTTRLHLHNRSEELLKPSPELLQKIRGDKMSMIFQEPMSSLNPVFTCGNQIVETILQHRKIKPDTARQMAISLLKQVGLSQPERIFASYPHQISGGQRQRVMMAIALSCQPELVIADEPTTALDVITQKGILEMINELKISTNTAFLFISHDLGVINAVCDRVAVLYKGEIVEQGTTEQILHAPEHDYTKNLIAARPVFGKRSRRLPAKMTASEITETQIISEKQAPERNEMLQSRQPILQVENLETWFSSPGLSIFQNKKQVVKAVSDVSFSVFPGETLGIVGESGSGKTTLGRSIVNLLETKAGKIIYDGIDLRGLSTQDWKKVRKDIQIIFQDPFGSLNPRKTVGAAVLEPILHFGLAENKSAGIEKVKYLFELTGLDASLIDRYPHEFSGGQRQRISIARALAVEPKVLICDECVSSLDVSVQAQILNLLLDLREKFNLTYLFISHDLAVVSFISDRIMVMQQGKLIEIGETEEICQQPKKSYTRQLIESVLTV